MVMGYVLQGGMVGEALVFSLHQSFYLEGKCTIIIYLENLMGGGSMGRATVFCLESAIPLYLGNYFQFQGEGGIFFRKRIFGKRGSCSHQVEEYIIIRIIQNIISAIGQFMGHR